MTLRSNNPKRHTVLGRSARCSSPVNGCSGRGHAGVGEAIPTTDRRRTMDENRAAEFTGRVLADTAAAATVVLAALGDRTGLFKELAAGGPGTSGELAGRTGLAERYVREWAAGLYAAGY